MSSTEIDLAECFTRDNYVVYHFTKDVQDSIRTLLGKLLTLQSKNQFGHQLLSKAYLIELFVKINQYNNDESVYTLSSKMKNRQMIAVVKQYIMEHLDEDITIEELADYVSISRSHFMHTFKNSTGMTAYQYTQKTRLQTAKSYILNGQSFTEASQNCGFSDYSSFYRAFYKVYKQSPSQYFENISQVKK